MNNSPKPQAQEIAQRVQTAPAFVVTDEQRELSDVQAAALWLYRLGINNGPTRHGSKIPFLWRALVGTRVVDPDRSEKHLRLFLDLYDNGAGIFVLPGRLSLNLAILDCDTLQAARHMLREFEKRNLRPWIVETAKGSHFWFLSEDGELANSSGDGWQLWGNCHYCLAPPSVHPSGVIYQWQRREGKLPPSLSIDQLDWLGLKLQAERRKTFEPKETKPLDFLSQRNRDFTENGATIGERNIRLFAAACDYQGNNKPMGEALAELAPMAEQAGLDRREVQSTIRSAYRKARTPAKKGMAVDLPTWVKAFQWAEAHRWTALDCNVNGRTIRITAQTARDVFRACCERERRDSSMVWRGTIREIAELANVNKATAYNALKCLCAHEYIVPRGYSPSGAALFSLSKNARKAYSKTNGTVLVYEYRAFSCDIRSDAFRRGALGKTAGRAWALILKEALKPWEIAERLGCHIATAKRALEGLEKKNLAKRVGSKKWVGLSADDERLKDIAAICGTMGKTQARREKHADERREWVTDRILKAKHNWERKRFS